MLEMLLSDEMMLNYHLMHPGGDSAPGDPNLAYYFDGTYHLHYILRHKWESNDKSYPPEGESFSFVHVTSPDMLHWTWEKTKLQPDFTGHGMFSGTGFITNQGTPAAIYCGVSEPRNTFIITTEDKELENWNKPYRLKAKDPATNEEIRLLGDPDLFKVGKIYYAYSASNNVRLCKSTNLIDWEYVGPLMPRNFPGVASGEDLSCANLFPFGDKWMLLCISHSMGCRYYIGAWDSDIEQFIPEIHGRMNWARHDQSLKTPEYRDFFAPESVLTADGRRVMWAWLATADPAINQKTVQSLPRELSLHNDGSLRIEPLRELHSLRYDKVTFEGLSYFHKSSQNHANNDSDQVVVGAQKITDLPEDSYEIKITIDRDQAEGKRFGFNLFAENNNEGLFFLVRPETQGIRLGETEAPFDLSELPDNQDMCITIFIDKYLVEVFVNGRQALLQTFIDYSKGSELRWYVFKGGIMTFGPNSQNPDMVIQRIDIWKIRPANEGLIEARQTRIWEPNTSF